MRLTMLQLLHVKTSTDRLETRLESASRGSQSHRSPATEGRPGRVAAGPSRDQPGADRRTLGSRTGLGASPPTAVSPGPQDAFAASKDMGRTATGVAELGRGSGVPGSVGRAGSGRRGLGGLASSGGAGRKARPENRPFGDVPPLGTARVAESGSRYAAPEKRCGGPGGVEKKTPRSTGNLADSRSRWGPPGAPDVSRRGALRTEGAPQAVLGPRPAATRDRQRLRAGICLCLRSG